MFRPGQEDKLHPEEQLQCDTVTAQSRAGGGLWGSVRSPRERAPCLASPVYLEHKSPEERYQRREGDFPTCVHSVLIGHVRGRQVRNSLLSFIHLTRGNQRQRHILG